MGIHEDCFKVFREDCKIEDAFERVWFAVVSRRPWRGVPSLPLDDDTNAAVELVRERAEKLGIPGLRSLPSELIQMIRDYRKSEDFWRYIAVLNVSRDISAASVNTNLPSPTLTIPLCNISAWARGKGQGLLHSAANPPIIRLTIDGRGIRQVERLPRRPMYQQCRADNVAYVIQEESQLEDVQAQLKVDLSIYCLERDEAWVRCLLTSYSMMPCAFDCLPTSTASTSGIYPTLLLLRTAIIVGAYLSRRDSIQSI